MNANTASVAAAPTSDQVLALWNEAMANNRAGLDAMQYFARELLARYGGQASTCIRPRPDVVELAREGMALHRLGQPEHIVCAELARIADAVAAKEQ